jgi:transmembrane protein
MNAVPSTQCRPDTPPFVARLLDNSITLLAARVAVTLPFLVGGFSKLVDWHGGEAEMLHVGLHPAWAFNLASLLTQLLGSALIIVNRRVWLGAGALGVFTVIATLLAHRFWNLSGEARFMQMNSFFEHWTICAAFVLVTVVRIRRRPRKL